MGPVWELLLLPWRVPPCLPVGGHPPPHPPWSSMRVSNSLAMQWRPGQDRNIIISRCAGEEVTYHIPSGDTEFVREKDSTLRGSN